MLDVVEERIERLMSMHRLEALTDGVFAIAMTILVLGLDVPSLGENPTSLLLLDRLRGMIPQFVNFVISFLILGKFWVGNNVQFHYIEQTNREHLWRYLLFLIFVVLLPFSTSLMGDYVGVNAAEVVFHGNLFILGVLNYLNWRFIIDNQVLVDDDKKDVVTLMYYRNGALGFVIAPLLAVGLALLTPGYSTLTYVLVPLISRAARRAYPDGGDSFA
ncbi:MAG: TMEM175 family protein [Candidatus Bipolaricaulota bacterium]